MMKARIQTLPPPIPEVALDLDAITAGLQAVVRMTVHELHDGGLSAFSFRDGQVVEVPPPKSK